MSWSLDPSQTAQIGQLSNQYPFAWLFEIEVPTSPPTRVRTTAYTEAIEFGKDSSGAAISYSPFPFEVGTVREDSEASLPTITISVSNITREMQALVETHDGLVGQPCILQLVNIASLESGAFLRYEGEILSLAANESAIAFEVGSYNLQRQVFPSNRALKDFCRFRYKSNRCGYTGALPSCDKTLNGPNGCTVHSNSDRFGGFPSIATPS